MTNERSEWTPMAEAISFISATVGEPYTAAQGNGLYWSTFAVRRPDGVMPYPIAVHNLGSEVKFSVSLSDADHDHATTTKLCAIIGWATVHGHECEYD